MHKRPPSPPQLELYPGWLPSSTPAPKPELPFQRSAEIDVPRVSRILGVSCKTVFRLVRRGMIRGYQVTEHSVWRIEYDSIVDYCNRLRVRFGISNERLLRKPLHGRLRDSDLLPFPLDQTVYYDTAVERLGLCRASVFQLIESGKLLGYKAVLDSAGCTWRIYEPSLDRYIAAKQAQVASPTHLQRTASVD